MGIYDLLNEAIDVRKGGNDCDFNGYLEDYLTILDKDEEVYQLFETLLETDSDIKVCVNYHIALSSNSISNLIIRYKDINKLDAKAIACPYILYFKKNDVQKAILLASEYVIGRAHV